MTIQHKMLSPFLGVFFSTFSFTIFFEVPRQCSVVKGDYFPWHLANRITRFNCSLAVQYCSVLSTWGPQGHTAEYWEPRSTWVHVSHVTLTAISLVFANFWKVFFVASTSCSRVPPPVLAPSFSTPHSNYLLLYAKIMTSVFFPPVAHTLKLMDQVKGNDSFT